MANTMQCFTKILHILVSMLLFWDMEFVRGKEYVLIEDGLIEGVTLTTRKSKNITGFLGIPYGKPPVGPLRFKSPVAAEPWEDIIVANTDGNQCPQLGDDGEVVGDEDCLYLNVYTQPINAENGVDSNLYPVMVYIHPGGFVRGNASRSNFGPEYLLDKDIVLVTMNYRLGALGFLSTDDEVAPGNYGLKDQLLALKWVKKNIENFGGDQNRVTLFGHDAGGVSASLHGASKASDGLFHRFISQSGTAICPWAYTDSFYKDEYIKTAKKLGDKLDCPLNNSKVLIDCLREKDTKSLVGASNLFDDFNFLQNWGPIDEPKLKGAFLTEYPLLQIDREKSYRSILGNVADEGLLYTAELYSNDNAYKKLVDNFDAFVKYVTTKYLNDDKYSERYSTIVNASYFLNVSSSDKEGLITNVTNFLSDAGFLSPADQMAERMLERNSIVYYYSFNYQGTFSKTSRSIDGNGNIGINHGDDVNYLFPVNDEQFNGLTKSDEEIIDTLIELWTSFAATGVPSAQRFSEPNFWPLYNITNRDYLKIGNNADTTVDRRNNFHGDRLELWAGLGSLAFYDSYLQKMYGISP